MVAEVCSALVEGCQHVPESGKEDGLTHSEGVETESYRKVRFSCSWLSDKEDISLCE